MKKQTVLIVSLILGASVASGFGMAEYEQFKKFFDFQMEEEGDVALIDMNGQITPSSQPSALGGSSDITPDKVRDLHEEAEQQNVDAVIYEINSGGGTVVASKEIMREIDSMEIPTVCRFRETAASGAYLAALGCDEIVADSGSITGSIGVTASYPEFSELMDDYGIDYINVTSGERKEVGSPFRNTTEEDVEILRNMTDQIHHEFLTEVEDHRNLTEDQKEAVETGQIFLGEEAMENGLVDQLGGRETAIQAAENETGKNLNPEKISTDPDFNLFSLLLSSPFDQFMSGFSQENLIQARWR